MRNLIRTPHIAADTAETELWLAELTAENVRRMAKGEQPAMWSASMSTPESSAIEMAETRTGGRSFRAFPPMSILPPFAASFLPLLDALHDRPSLAFQLPPRVARGRCQVRGKLTGKPGVPGTRGPRAHDRTPYGVPGRDAFGDARGPGPPPLPRA